MGLDLPSGGHLTHGYQTTDKSGNIKKISSSAIYFNSICYTVCNDTGLIDYLSLEINAMKYKPKLIICGASAYPRDWDYYLLREIANKCVKLNAKTLAQALQKYGYEIVTNGTDNHIVLWDLRPLNLTGSKMEKICEYVNITHICFNNKRI